ncbi:carbohydrate-binding protein with CBM35 doain [Jejuia pallidilutea]|uniref:Carbohydrate-binding protein with CBM35 doain n=1 Tax=Jejuia pallidilutea TaxID=504487 RepID=A0A362X099_9FLAO|nr:family 43 glycosylhydrolase [Jejuia pallidilutea]PQV48989.1 carbohydrate-binding protein with CBM35 doain [Jejuia pallidilutea]
MKKSLLVLLFTSVSVFSIAQNPVFTHLFTADPAPHVWPNDDRLWVYTTRDEPGSNNHYGMTDYHAFSTTDMVNWTDHGRILHLDNVDWAESHAWAMDAVYYRDHYYLIYCMKEAGIGLFRTGVARSDVPEGPFTDLGYVKGVEFGQDPAIFIDDDGTPYLFWGHDRKCFGAELNSDLMSIKPETYVDLTSQLTHVFEGPWVHKYKGKYYLTYPGLTPRRWPEKMFYAVADKPLGPYEFKDCFIDDFEGQSGTNHGGIVTYKGKDIMFYHSAWLSGGLSETRSVMADYLHYDKDGNIIPIVPSKKGLGNANRTKTTIHLEAENGFAAGGKLYNVIVDTYMKDYGGKGYVTNFDNPYDHVSMLAQVAKPAKYRFIVRYASPEGESNHDVLINSHQYREFKFPKSETFREIDFGPVELKAGDNIIRILRSNWKPTKGYFALDYIKLEQIFED